MVDQAEACPNMKDRAEKCPNLVDHAKNWCKVTYLMGIKVKKHETVKEECISTIYGQIWNSKVQDNVKVSWFFLEINSIGESIRFGDKRVIIWRIPERKYGALGVYLNFEVSKCWNYLVNLTKTCQGTLFPQEKKLFVFWPKGCGMNKAIEVTIVYLS